MAGMFSYPKAAMERAMKVQEVILRAMARKITWWQAAEIIGISDRHMRRWRERYEEFGYDGLFDRRRGKPAPKRVPLALGEQVLGLYRDRGSHFWLTPKVGGKVDSHRLTQVGRALRELDIQMIPAYSPQARGRSERNFGTWQGRLPQELRLQGITTLEAANAFLREHYMAEFNRRFQVRAAQPGSAFMLRRSRDLDLIFALQFERTVNRDNTVSIQNLSLQIEAVRWRASLAGCTVTVHQHLDGSYSLTHGPHRLGRYSAQGAALADNKTQRGRAVEKTRAGKVQNPTFPPRLEIPQKALDSHFPTAPTAAGHLTQTGQVTC